MIKRAVFENELIDGMQRILVASEKQNSSLSKAVDYLNSAIDIFEDTGMYSQANQILGILTKIAEEDWEDWEDEMHGGLADNKTPKNFNPKTIAKGVKVEMEHTNSRHLAIEIVMDHLMENPNYYDYLEDMEAEMDNAKDSQ